MDQATQHPAISAVQRYVILEHDRIQISVAERISDGWQTSLLGAGDILHMPEIGIEVPVDEFHEGVGLVSVKAT